MAFVAELLSYSLLLVGVLALIKFQHINPAFYPFVFLIWIGVLNESISSYLKTRIDNNSINTNIYAIAEGCLLLWFFRNTGTLTSKYLSRSLLIILLATWVIDTFLIGDFGKSFSSYYIILSSFITVLLCITGINKLLVKEKDLLKNSSFIIYMGLLIYFMYSILVEIFWMYGLKLDDGFGSKVYFILSLVNPICNLIYAWAILWMRKRQAFTLQF